MTIFVIGGGSVDEDVLKEQIDSVNEAERVIIACDRGAEICLNHGIKPDYCVGDFDSASPGTLERLSSLGLEIKKLNPVKDDTDAESALNYACDNYDGPIVFIGCTGSRIDHVLGNIALIGMCKTKGRELTLVDKTNKIYMLSAGEHRSIEAKKQYGRYVSVIPYMGEVEGLTMTGFKYPLDKALIKGFNTLTISNEIVADRGEISIEKGFLIIIESQD